MTRRRLKPLRARAWLRDMGIPARTDLLLSHTDDEIRLLAASEGYRLTCPGDLRRERGLAVPELPFDRERGG